MALKAICTDDEQDDKQSVVASVDYSIGGVDLTTMDTASCRRSAGWIIFCKKGKW